MREYARQRGLRRMLISVPVLTPRLSSLWLGLVTPVYARIGRQLIEGMRNPTVVRDDAALRTFAIRPIGLAEAIRRALVFEDHAFAETRWSDAFSVSERSTSGALRVGSRPVDTRTREVAVPADVARANPPDRRPDRLVLGQLDSATPRLHRSPRLAASDCDAAVLIQKSSGWGTRSTSGGSSRSTKAGVFVCSPRMKTPGRAWLEFEVTDAGDRHSMIDQTAVFDPSGLGGLLYWYGLYPIHVVSSIGCCAASPRARSDKSDRSGVADDRVTGSACR